MVNSGCEGPADTFLVTPTMDLSGRTSAAIQWANDYITDQFEPSVVSVDVSDDGGSNWTNVWTRESDVPGPGNQIADMSFAAGHANVAARFHYQGFFSRTWQVDDVKVGSFACAVTPGGLVVGTVSDANTGAGLTGATIQNLLGRRLDHLVRDSRKRGVLQPLRRRRLEVLPGVVSGLRVRHAECHRRSRLDDPARLRASGRLTERRSASAPGLRRSRRHPGSDADSDQHRHERRKLPDPGSRRAAGRLRVESGVFRSGRAAPGSGRRPGADARERRQRRLLLPDRAGVRVRPRLRHERGPAVGRQPLLPGLRHQRGRPRASVPARRDRHGRDDRHPRHRRHPAGRRDLQRADRHALAGQHRRGQLPLRDGSRHEGRDRQQDLRAVDDAEPGRSARWPTTTRPTPITSAAPTTTVLYHIDSAGNLLDSAVHRPRDRRASHTTRPHGIFSSLTQCAAPWDVWVVDAVRRATPSSAGSA